MTLIVVGLLCLVLGIVLGAWCAISIADAFLKPIYKQGDSAMAACYGLRKTEQPK